MKVNIRQAVTGWRQQIHINTQKGRLICGGLVFLLYAGAGLLAFLSGGFSASDAAILAALAIASEVILLVEVPLFLLIRIAAALVVPLGCFYVFETLTHPISGMIDHAKWLNIGFFYWFFLMLFLITGRTKVSMAIGVVLMTIIGIGNYFVVEFRSSPIVPWDVYSIQTAASVAGNYSFTVTWELAWHFGMFLFMLVLGMRTNIRLKCIPIRAVAAGLMLIPAYFYISYLWQDDLERNTGLNDTLFNAKWMHSKDGFFVSFIVDLHFLQLQVPENYSDEAALALLAEQQVEEREIPQELPDVIVIMDETFSDPAVLGEFETNQDYMPFVHSILAGEVENTISGTTYVSVLGGNTANSEFEFLTGNSMAFFPNGSVPYLQYIREGVSSIVTQFQELGYITYGTHPHNSYGWKRDSIYPLMGFDYSLFKEDFPDNTKLRNYVSDEADFNSILEWCRQEEKPVFHFNVTMQNHSNYGDKYNKTFEPQIEARFKDSTSRSYLDNYLSLMYETDQQVEALIEELSASDRKTVVLFFGDHQPNDYVVRLVARSNGIDLDNTTYEQKQLRQQTPFFLWANYDIEEQTDLEISLNYLNILLFDTLEFPLDAYQTFRKSLWQGELPVLNALGYITPQGEMKELEEAQGEVQELLHAYQTIQYYRMEREYKAK